MQVKRITFAVALAGAFAAFPAFAGGGAQGASQGSTGDRFQSMDTDRNGYISQREWMGAGQKASTASQAQQSGSQQAASSQQQTGGETGIVVITLTPVQSGLMQRQQRESMFRQLDSDADGAITLGEAGVNTQLLQAFAQLDRDGDAVIERQEFASVHMQDGSSSSQAMAQSQQSASAGGTSSRQQAGGSSQQSQSASDGAQSQESGSKQ